jgi:4-phosphopantoate---beta-alanine ligase
LGTSIPPNHPRFVSLQSRAQLVNGFNRGLVASEGLIAHGRGEAFDYLLGERTTSMSFNATQAACCCLLMAAYPIISVNGNFAALCSTDIVKLSRLIPANIEVNLFHRSPERERLIKQELENLGTEKVLGSFSDESAIVPRLTSSRKFVHSDGIYKADVVMLSLEDGDRTQALMEMGKKVIAIDINPISRTAKTADITIVDNVTRVMPMMISTITTLKQTNDIGYMHNIMTDFNNKTNLANSLKAILSGLDERSNSE